jgi:S1-C subfamily serine protease
MDATTPASSPHAPTRRQPRVRVSHVALTAIILGGVPLAAAPVFAAAASASPSPRLLASGGLDVAAIAAKLDPAIVDINTTLSNGEAAGTGMVLTSSGEVLTNNHVIDGATDIRVQIGGTGASHAANVLGYDVADDVALLQIQGVSGLKAVTAGQVSQLSVGDPVVALGNALGQGGTPATATGTITGLDQTITATDDNGSNPETLNGMIEVDAPIQPGDSGGPLANADGAVIGMDSAGSSNGQFSQAATDAYAIPIDHALAIAHQIESRSSSGNVHIGARAILGVEVQDTSAQSTGGFGLDPWSPFGGGSDGGGLASVNGANVAGVEPNGPADSAGIAAGDTITSVDGSVVGSADDLGSALASHHPGDRVQVGWIDAAGQTQAATVTLVAGPPA